MQIRYSYNIDQNSGWKFRENRTNSFFTTCLSVEMGMAGK